jgi:hypothetical protein
MKMESKAPLGWIINPRTIIGKTCLAMLIVLSLCAATYFGGWLGERFAVLAIEVLLQVHVHAGPEGAAMAVAGGILLALTILASFVVRTEAAPKEDPVNTRLIDAFLMLYVSVAQEVVLQDGGDLHEKPAMREARDALAAAGLIDLGRPEVKNA